MELDLLAIVQIVFADFVLSGDNAVVIAMAAAGLPTSQRRQAIMLGMAMAAGFRLFFAIIASFLLEIPGILLIGGILLAWVCWRFYSDIRSQEWATSPSIETPEGARKGKSGGNMRRALLTIAMADISMSIDNVLAIAAIARDDRVLLMLGMAFAILLMVLCATIIMRILHRYPLLSWLGLLFLVYLTGLMLYDGTEQLLEYVM
ncbi:MAG: YjbE family putative metal transport protein [Rhodobacteraceae bacterium]|nr:YjbE family putative metal transport protein [Paracoccaceae bacterium]